MRMKKRRRRKLRKGSAKKRRTVTRFSEKPDLKCIKPFLLQNIYTWMWSFPTISFHLVSVASKIFLTWVEPFPLSRCCNGKILFAKTQNQIRYNPWQFIIYVKIRALNHIMRKYFSINTQINYLDQYYYLLFSISTIYI